MLLRFRGGGVGHRTTREATSSFLNDRDPLDIHQASAAVAHSDSEDEGSNDDECDLIDDEEGLARGKAMELDEGDKSDLDDYNDYGYSGIQQEIEDSDEDRRSEDEEDVNATKGDGDDEIDDELGAEDGEDSDEELEGFSEF
jgi:hypothetical protein